MLSLKLSPPTKKVHQKTLAFRAQYSFGDFHAVVQQFGVGDAEFTPDGAESQIAASENQAAQPRRDDGARAHRTGLQRHIEGGILQTVIPCFRRGRAQRQDLGVRRGIGGAAWLVESFAYNRSTSDSDRSHRHFAGSLGLPRQLDRPPQERFVAGPFAGADGPFTGIPSAWVELWMDRIRISSIIGIGGDAGESRTRA